MVPVVKCALSEQALGNATTSIPLAGYFCAKITIMWRILSRVPGRPGLLPLSSLPAACGENEGAATWAEEQRSWEQHSRHHSEIISPLGLAGALGAPSAALALPMGLSWLLGLCLSWNPLGGVGGPVPGLTTRVLSCDTPTGGWLHCWGSVDTCPDAGAT